MTRRTPRPPYQVEVRWQPGPRTAEYAAIWRWLMRGPLLDSEPGRPDIQNHIGVLFDEADGWGVQFEFVTERFEDTAMGRFILAARAFMAEVEREKIAERTMRGKAERARAGKLPQSTGRGLYGYTYNRDTGQREVEATQAAVVRRVYEHYAATRSFSAVANELNAAGVPAFSGGRWHPLTIRNVLTNESYTGRTVYRRTQRVKTRSVRTQKRTTRVVERPESDWIEVEGATPPIIPNDLWRRVKEIIEDPERISRRPESRHYLLSGRARCRICKSAMIGQTLTAKGKPYRYYRCRHSYDKNSGRQCEARYVSAEQMESHLWDAVRAVLSEPSRSSAAARVRCQVQPLPPVRGCSVRRVGGGGWLCTSHIGTSGRARRNRGNAAFTRPGADGALETDGCGAEWRRGQTHRRRRRC